MDIQIIFRNKFARHVCNGISYWYSKDSIVFFCCFFQAQSIYKYL